MPFQGNKVSFEDSGQIDSYQRLRSASPQSIMGLFMSNGIHPLYFNTSVVGAGAVAFNANQSAARLSVSTGSTDSIIVQTKRYLRYQPGYSYQLILAGVLGSAKTNVRQRLGYFDINDGIFFEQTGATGISIVSRTSTSGSPVDTSVAQSNWNLDKLDGSGPSGVTLDPSKYNAYVMDYVWQGAGRVRIGLILNNRIIYCHEIFNSNLNTAPFMRSPSRPGRIELTNTGAVGTGTNLDVTCVTALKESLGDIIAPYTFSASRGTNTKSINSATPLPLISLRPATTFNGIVNRVPISPIEVEAFTVQDSLYVQLILNPTTLTGASFSAVNSSSSAQFDISATAVSGGTVIFETYVGGGGKGSNSILDISDIAILGLDIAGSVQDTITVAAAKINGNTDAVAKIRYQEFQ